MLDRAFLRLTLVEWVVLAVVLLFLARMIWAPSILGVEDSLFDVIGLDGAKRFFLLVPLGGWFFYRVWAREARRATGVGRVFRVKVLLLCGALLGIAAAVLYATAGWTIGV